MNYQSTRGRDRFKTKKKKEKKMCSFVCTDSGEIDVSLQPLAAGVDGRAGIFAAVGLLESFDKEDATDIADQLLG